MPGDRPPVADSAWAAVRHIPGLTYRRFDYWVNRGLVQVSIERGKTSGTGNYRIIAPVEVDVVALMMALTREGFTLEAAAPLARRLTNGQPARIGMFTITTTSVSSKQDDS